MATGLVTTAAAAQRPTIEVRKIRTMVDLDGKGFTRAPITITPIYGGRYALAEMNELPLVIDSTGRLVKRFLRGRGPGELSGYSAAVVSGPGDSLYVANMSSIHVFDRGLKHVRTIAGVSSNWLVETRGGFVTSISTSSRRSA